MAKKKYTPKHAKYSDQNVPSWDNPRPFTLAIEVEYRAACRQHGRAFKSLHEGNSVIREEYLELEREIFKKKPDLDKIYGEAKQLGAMAVKMMVKVSQLKGFENEQEKERSSKKTR